MRRGRGGFHGCGDRSRPMPARASFAIDSVALKELRHIEPRPDLLHSTIYRGASPGVLRKMFAPK
jgi:hypothetical protein